MKMNGHIISGTSICVDYWLWTPEEKYHHFLTHLHADHTVNLKSTFREKIYTSHFNAWLLRRWFNISSECIVALDVGESHLVFDTSTQTRFSVTALDANHCPGSVMFLFQGNFGNILYTGDFRYNPRLLKHPMLKSLIENEAVDKLYLDNTFAAEHCDFPPRQEALKDVINLIKDHPDHNILLGVRKLGKEEVLRAIALELKEKVCVSNEKLRILAKLGYENVFTTDSEDSRIFMKEMPHITPRFIDQLRAERGPVVTILLTALYSVMPPQAKYSVSADTEKGIYKIPYSDHSCHSELVEFVSKVKPKEIFPIVSSSKGNKVNSSQSGDLTEILSYTWQNSVIPKSIMEFSGNLKNWGVVIPMSKNKENVVSYMTEDDSETSCENVIGISKRIQASKVQMEEKGEDQVGKSEGGMTTENELPEIISKRNLTPTEGISQMKNQEVRFSKKSINSGSKTGLANPEASEEYFTMSDEDLSQLNVYSDRQNITDKPNSTSKEVLDNSDVIMRRDQTVNRSNEDSLSHNLCSDSVNHPLENQVDREKHVNFTPCTPPLTRKCMIFKKRPPTPMPKAESTNTEEEDEENESYGSVNSGAQSEADDNDSLLDHLVQLALENEVGTNYNNLHPTQSSVCDLGNHQNLAESEDFQNLNLPIPSLKNNGTFFKKHSPTVVPRKKHTNMEVDDDEENKSNGFEKLNASREKHNEGRKFTCDISNARRTRIDEQYQVKNVFCDNITDQNVKENPASQCDVGKQVMFTSSSPVQQNKSEMLKKHLSTPVPMEKLVTEENVDKVNNSSSPPSAKTFQDKHVLKNNNNNNNFELNIINILPDALNQNPLLNNISDKKRVICNRKVLASNSKLSEKNIPGLMSTNANQSDNCHTSDCLHKTSSVTEFSFGATSKRGTQFGDDEKRKNDFRASILKRIFQPQLLPTEKPNVAKTGHTNDCLQNISSSVPKGPVGETSAQKDGNQFDEDKKIKNDIRASIIKRIFQPHLPTAKQNVRKNGHTNGCLQNAPNSVPKVPIGARSVPKVGNQFGEDEKRKNFIRASTSQSPITKRNVVNSGHTDDFVHNSSSSDSDISVKVTKRNRMEHEDNHFEQGGSDSTVSDFEDNGMSLEMFEILDRRNDQICKSSKNNSSTSINIRISEKFKHLLVKELPNKSSGSGFFSPVRKTNQERTSTVVVSSLAQNKVLLKSNSRQSSLIGRQNEDKCSEIEGVNCLKENSATSQGITKRKGTKRKNGLVRHNCISDDIPSKKVRVDEFCEVFVNTCKCWKEAVRKACEEQKVGFEQVG